MGKLDGKVALVTGATTGIGAAMARLFAQEGARLIIGGRREHLAQRLAAELGDSVVPLRMNVASEADIAAGVDLAMREFGRLDCLVNNAGSAGAIQPISETTAEALDETIAVLFRAVVLGIKHGARAMQEQKSGVIINTASVAGFFTGFAPHVYSACKAAVIQLTRSAAVELGEKGIRVNCICPGPVPTPIFGNALGLPAESSEVLAQNLKTVFSNAQPLKRAGLPIDIAKAALWLVSDDASFINGHALVVDGGLSLGQSWSGFQAFLGTLAAHVPGAA